jgi:hypothetical protein
VTAAVICTTTFETLARNAARDLGMPGLPLVVVQHPLGGLRREEVETRVLRATEQLAALLGSRPGGAAEGGSR